MVVRSQAEGLSVSGKYTQAKAKAKYRFFPSDLARGQKNDYLFILRPLSTFGDSIGGGSMAATS
jgi:hypothetical protein